MKHMKEGLLDDSNDKADHPRYGDTAALDGISWDSLPTGSCRRFCTPVRYAWCVRRHMALFWLCSILGVLGGIFLGVGLTGRAFARQCPDDRPSYYHGCFTSSEFFGVFVVVMSVPCGVLALGGAVVALGRRVNQHSRTAVANVIAWAAFVCLLLVVIVIPVMIQPELTYQNKDIDYLWVFYGGFLTTAFTPIGATLLVISWKIRFAAPPQLNGSGRGPRTYSELTRLSVHDRATYFANHPSRPAFEPQRLLDNFSRIAWGLFVLLWAYWMTTIFSCVWNFYAGAYFPFYSEYSMWDWVVSGRFQFKFYKDTFVYYMFLIGLLLLGALAHFWLPLRRITTRRIRIHRPSEKWWMPFPYGVSIGEIIVIAGVMGLFVWWFYFWRFDYGRIEKKAYEGEYPEFVPDEYPTLHIAARVTGHICSLSMGLLLLPVTKNSIWEASLGIPFERAIRYHRFMGVIAYILMTLHMLFWYFKWMKEGIFWHNLVNFDWFLIHPQDPHYDNFTPLMMTIMWVFMSVVIVIAVWWRRSNYTLFYITHLFSIIFFIATIMHAWSFWYFAAGPLFLWFWDRLVRWFRASTASVTLVAMEYNAASNITKLELPREAFTHYAGQYAYLQLSVLSPLEWHPFTMSSPPSGATRTFHIKAEAPGSWTYRLAREAERLNRPTGVQMGDHHNGNAAAGHQLKPHLPTISVDAPYGRASYIEGHTTLLMVAGGIGATPFISLFSELYSRVCASENAGEPLEPSLAALKKVKFVWTARSDDLLCTFCSLVYAVGRHNPGGIFEIDLHATSKRDPRIDISPKADPASPLQTSTGHETHNVYAADDGIISSVAGGDQAAVDYTRSKILYARPDLITAARTLAMTSPGRSTLALACGPTQLVDATSELAFDNSFDFHHEVFYF